MATRQYIGARYVPKFADPTEWDSTITYEPLTIVLHEGNSYTSKKNVPVGVDISNETYWVLTGNYNQQVAAMQTQVENMQTQVTGAVEASEKAEEAAEAATTAANAATTAANKATSTANTASSTASQANSALTTIGSWNAAGTSYTLKPATTTTAGSIVSGTSGNTNGLVVVNSDGTATVPVASASGYGIVKVDGTTITADNGVLTATAGTSYTLPAATDTTLGGVMVPGSNSSDYADISYKGDLYMSADDTIYSPVATTSRLGCTRPSVLQGLSVKDDGEMYVKLPFCFTSLYTTQTLTKEAADLGWNTYEYYSMTISGKTFTPNVNGWYLITASLGVVDLSSGNSIHLTLYHDDTEVFNIWNRAGGVSTCVTFSSLFFLTAGTYYNVKAYNATEAAGTTTVNGSHLSVVYVYGA